MYRENSQSEEFHYVIHQGKKGEVNNASQPGNAAACVWKGDILRAGARDADGRKVKGDLRAGARGAEGSEAKGKRHMRYVDEETATQLEVGLLLWKERGRKRLGKGEQD